MYGSKKELGMIALFPKKNGNITLQSIIADIAFLFPEVDSKLKNDF